MDDEPDIPIEDPELAALLRFEPVPRKQERASGWWSPDNQRTFIRTLAETGNYRLAAGAVGLSANSVYQLRKEPGGEDFARAWEEAVALHRKRTAPAPRHARALRDARAHQAAAADAPSAAEIAEVLDEILGSYIRKVQAERAARLAGRIVEADLCVRQLTWLELVLAIGGRTQEVLELWREGDLSLVQVAANPMSVLLERARRAVWLEEPALDRPPPAPLGSHDAQRSIGESNVYSPARDGDFHAWQRAREEKRRLAAEAQQAWEARARGEAGTPWSGTGGDPEPAS
jgi:hypothetical protein